LPACCGGERRAWCALASLVPGFGLLFFIVLCVIPGAPPPGCAEPCGR
jgi:hypothetical protein